MDNAMKTLITDSFKSIDLYPMNDKLREMCKTPNGCYEPPFTGYMGDYAQKTVEEINEQGDTVIYNEIVRQIAIDVDKDEMIRALNYDRDQYNKGYNDGYTKAQNELVMKIIAKCNYDMSSANSMYGKGIIDEAYDIKEYVMALIGQTKEDDEQ